MVAAKPARSCTARRARDLLGVFVRPEHDDEFRGAPAPLLLVPRSRLAHTFQTVLGTL